MRWSSSSTPRSTLYAASRVFVIRSRWSAGSCTNAFMRAAVSRLRSSRFWMRTSSRRFRDVAAAEEKDVVEALLLHQLADAREDVVVRAREQREANGVGVLLQRCLDDLFRCLMHTGVNDFHPGIAQRPCHDFRAAIVPVETGFCDDDADGPFHSGMPSSAKCSSQWRYV